MSSRINIFAYGSNLSATQMMGRCPSARLMGPARLAGHRLAFNRYSRAWQGGVADVVPDHSSEVWGVVWTISEDEISVLDRFEVVPRGYTRKLLEVSTNVDDRVPAWTYQVVVKSDHVAPTPAYLGIILNACREHGFPDSHRLAVETAAVTPVPIGCETVRDRHRGHIQGRARVAWRDTSSERS